MRTILRRTIALSGLTAVVIVSGSIAAADGTAVRDITDRALSEVQAEPTDLATTDLATGPAPATALDGSLPGRVRAAEQAAPVDAPDPSSSSTTASPAPRVASAPDRGDRTAAAPGWTWHASWYGPGFHGNTTANGETYDQYAMTAAHKTLPFGTQLRVTNVANGRSVVVRINDRGPFIAGRDLDLSKGAAEALGFAGVATVHVIEL